MPRKAQPPIQRLPSGRCRFSWLRGRTVASPQRGFTLIELLAAISILAIVAVLSWRGLDTILRTRVALTTTLEQTRGLQLAFAQMQSDCENIVKSDDIGRRATLLAEPGRLTLVRTTYADDQPSRLQVVSYRLSDGVLSRRESEATRDLRVLDGLWSAASSDAGLGTSVILQSGVAAMNLRLWNNTTGWIAAGAPAPQPPPQTAATATPTGLEVALQLGENQSGMVKVMLLGAI